jgi:hypothetical protein
MKIAAISDMHLGDPLSTLVAFDAGAGGEPVNLRPGSRYQAFCEAVRGESKNVCDYLVLLGDVLDFSIAEYRHAYEVGRFFFKRLKRDAIARQIIYVPGNHDFDLWHAVEYQTSVINRMMNGQPVRRFRMSAPGVLDDRPDASERGFSLPRAERRPGAESAYDGLFLDYITGRRRSARTLFNFAYPNLYLITDDNQTVLLTHGHYFEAYWSLLGEWAPRIFGGDLKAGTEFSLRDLVSVNFPLTQLACSGTGQAGPLTTLAHRIQEDARLRNLADIRRYLDNLERGIDDATRFGWAFWNEWVADSLSAKLKNVLLEMIGERGFVVPRGNREFISDENVQQRVRNYCRATRNEIDELHADTGLRIPPPRSIIWGHSHVRDPWGDSNAPVIDLGGSDAGTVVLYNTGGWLESRGETGELQFDGAEIFIYETGLGFRSVSVG